MSKSFEQGRDEIAKLCKYFTDNREVFTAPTTKEAIVRQALIDPLFEALGWDVHNAQRLAPQNMEVVYNPSMDDEGHRAEPDYAFRVGSSAKFYVEAKKCSVDIAKDSAPAIQLRQYGWNPPGLSPCVLTNFKELAVYKCTVRPRQNDKASLYRVSLYHFHGYTDRWRELWDIFSHEAVWQSGAFDRYAATHGTSDFDAEFLKEIEGWRGILAKNIAQRNEISVEDLNAVVQVTIDRVVFLRMAESKGIEPDGQLLKLCERDDVYPRFIRNLCRKADEKYNSGLFHFEKEEGVHEAPDRITPKLTVDDKVFRPILQSLYLAHGSPYHFHRMPVEILGTIYERFLGKVIRLTQGGRVIIEDKPEVIAARGIHYTPAYIARYIVEHTLGRQIEHGSPIQVAGSKGKTPLRVLDMACGSGSFLLAAYHHLLEHCLNWYIANEPRRYLKAVYRDSPDDVWRLTIAEKKRILTTHIFGVDIDYQAVEVTKLSLLLKVLAGETKETVDRQQRLFHDRALPNLADNIKCGNSLVGSDYFIGRLNLEPKEMDGELIRVKPFDWKKGFPDAIRAGGFDCLIGNPPYVFTRETFTPSDRTYYSDKYKLSYEKKNTYMLFMEKLLHLISSKALGAFIVPNSWLTIESAKLLRQSYLNRLRRVVDLNFPAFHGVSMEPCIFIVDGSDIEGPIELVRVNAASQLVSATCNLVERASLKKHNRIVFYGSEGTSSLIERILTNSKPLGTLFDVRTGLQAYEKGKGKPPQSALDVREHVFDRHRRENKDSIPYLEGKDVLRYTIHWSGLWMQYGPWLSQPREIGIFTRPRILLREITGPEPYCLNFAYVEKQFLNNKSILNVLDYEDNNERLKILVGVLNSRLMSFFYKHHAIKSGRKIFPKVVVKDLGCFPVPKAVMAYRCVAHLVESIFVLHRTLATAKSEAQKTVIQRQIDATDAEIDRLVYDLYGLTKEEIEIVEGSRLAG